MHTHCTKKLQNRKSAIEEAEERARKKGAEILVKKLQVERGEILEGLERGRSNWSANRVSEKLTAQEWWTWFEKCIRYFILANFIRNLKINVLKIVEVKVVF